MFEFYRKNKSIIKKNKNEFRKLKFIHNNYTILFIGYFLFLEQFIYFLFLANNNSTLEKIHLVTSFVALFYAFVATYFKLKKNYEYSKVKSFYEISFGIVGFIVAMLRVILITKDSFYLPVIYIAVIYGFSFIFYFKPYKSFFIYFLSSSVIIFSLIFYTNYKITSRIIADIISNNIIAWLASVISYFKYSKNFINKKIIYQKNSKLKKQTREIKKINQKLKEINEKDSLIDIYNRRKLDEILASEIENFKNNKEIFSIIILDIDSFKEVNDNFGHNIGDQVLINIGSILKENIKKNCITGRWGGEEFLIICKNMKCKSSTRLARKLKKDIYNFDFGISRKITASFGVSSIKNNDDIDSLINRADMYLYKAKETGKNKVLSNCIGLVKGGEYGY